MADVALQALMFFPRGGSAQVVRYLSREIARGGRVRPRVVSGSLGPAGAPGDAGHFFAGLDLVAVDYDAALAAPDPLAASPPMHPSYEDRPGAPDRVVASLDDAAAEHLVREWRRILAAPGVLDDVAVAHLHHLTPVHEALAILRPDLPVVTHLHGTELQMLEAIAAGAPWAHGRAWAGRMRRWAARSARVLLGSEPARAEAAAVLGLPAGAIEVVPNGVDLELFDGRRVPPLERAAFWRRRLCEEPRGWSPDDPRPGAVAYTPAQVAPLADPGAPVVLFVGRVTAVKRIPSLIRAHARARVALGRPLPLVLWGGAPGEWEEEHPLDVAAASPWGREVFLAGWSGHEELPAALAAADVLAVPSAGERFGLVYVEAMAMGVPPIAGDAGAPPSFIEADPASPERAGWLVPPGDEAALAAALVEAASDPAERALRGANGRRLARRRFGWPGIARRVVAVYDEVTRTPTGRRAARTRARSR
ncbi:MAG TPA: glycosyltransferase family 4 protein [Miltoncostaeaceae bacterium]|nr:glycosyltransferase family 4 protein [Miltoncostaeaceae bacterium]